MLAILGLLIGSHFVRSAASAEGKDERAKRAGRFHVLEFKCAVRRLLCRTHNCDAPRTYSFTENHAAIAAFNACSVPSCFRGTIHLFCRSYIFSD